MCSWTTGKGIKVKVNVRSKNQTAKHCTTLYRGTCFSSHCLVFQSSSTTRCCSSISLMRAVSVRNRASSSAFLRSNSSRSTASLSSLSSRSFSAASAASARGRKISLSGPEQTHQYLLLWLFSRLLLFSFQLWHWPSWVAAG